ncbi:related to Mitochondrial import inner membrane translocase subunit TIM8 [Armillaria ostoyae]|nr:Tim10/DDP family zinc finger-domain-containing protein [Armillaria mellea]KAK0505883.1 Tim10/DDP family zinc finger-domain-containing protein [Armillaria luteobubalina]PBL00801.1 hypothetical protein ARMGADRAFT_1160086 [Armillaria gallica]SJL05969.1 related to Mitochondrial import inner membrane translocase subunit TIM8 [Armillaria ostoyae]
MADSAFDAATRRELDAFLTREQANAKLHTTIHNLTTMCWDKCITSTPSNKFSSAEASCLTNCVDRFLDTSLFLIKSLQNRRESE